MTNFVLKNTEDNNLKTENFSLRPLLLLLSSESFQKYSILFYILTHKWNHKYHWLTTYFLFTHGPEDCWSSADILPTSLNSTKLIWLLMPGSVVSSHYVQHAVLSYGRGQKLGAGDSNKSQTVKASTWMVMFIHISLCKANSMAKPKVTGAIITRHWINF